MFFSKHLNIFLINNSSYYSLSCPRIVCYHGWSLVYFRWLFRFWYIWFWWLQCISVANLKAALTKRNVIPNKSKSRGPTKKSLLVSQLKEFWESQNNNDTTISSSAKTTSLNQGFALTNVIKEHSYTEQLKTFLNHTGNSFDTSVIATTDEGKMFKDSVMIVEKTLLCSG